MFEMSVIEYRIMQNSDINEVLLFLGKIDGVHLHNNGEETYEAICSYLQRNPNLSFVAVCESEIVGAVMCGHDGRRGYLNHLGVSSEYRRKGIAKELLGRVESELIKAGIKKRKPYLFCATIHLHKSFMNILVGKKNQLLRCIPR